MAGKEIPVAMVYAESLFGIGLEQNTLETLTEEVRALADLLKQEPAFALLLEAPSISVDEKHGAVRRIFQGRASDVLVNFLCVVIDKGRTPLLREMVRSFELLLDRHKGIERGQAITAVPLTEQEQQALETWIRKRTGREVVMSARVDPDLIGGIVIKVGDQVLDTSVRTQIKELRERMLSKYAH